MARVDKKVVFDSAVKMTRGDFCAIVEGDLIRLPMELLSCVRDKEGVVDFSTFILAYIGSKKVRWGLEYRLLMTPYEIKTALDRLLVQLGYC